MSIIILSQVFITNWWRYAGRCATSPLVIIDGCRTAPRKVCTIDSCRITTMKLLRIARFVRYFARDNCVSWDARKSDGVCLYNNIMCTLNALQSRVGQMVFFWKYNRISPSCCYIKQTRVVTDNRGSIIWTDHFTAFENPSTIPIRSMHFNILFRCL